MLPSVTCLRFSDQSSQEIIARLLNDFLSSGDRLNGRLKRLLADAELDKAALKDLLNRKW